MFNNRMGTTSSKREYKEAIFVEPSPGLTLPLGQSLQNGGAYERDVENLLLLRTSQKIKLAFGGRPKVGTAKVDNVTERTFEGATTEKREHLGTYKIRLARRSGRYVLTRKDIEYPPGGDDVPPKMRT